MYTFNYRGLQDYSKRRKVFHNLKLIDRDIVYAQETRSDVKDEKKKKKIGRTSGANILGLPVVLNF